MNVNPRCTELVHTHLRLSGPQAMRDLRACIFWQFPTRIPGNAVALHPTGWPSHPKKSSFSSLSLSLSTQQHSSRPIPVSVSLHSFNQSNRPGRVAGPSATTTQWVPGSFLLLEWTGLPPALIPGLLPTTNHLPPTTSFNYPIRKLTC